MALSTQQAKAGYVRPDRRNRLVTFQAPLETRAALFYLAEQEGMSVSDLLRGMVRERIKGIQVPPQYLETRVRPGPRTAG